MILLRTEIIEDSGPDDLSVGLLCHKDRILIDNEHRRPAAKFVEAPVDGLAGLLRVRVRMRPLGLVGARDKGFLGSVEEFVPAHQRGF